MDASLRGYPGGSSSQSGHLQLPQQQLLQQQQQQQQQYYPHHYQQQQQQHHHQQHRQQQQFYASQSSGLSVSMQSSHNNTSRHQHSLDGMSVGSQRSGGSNQSSAVDEAYRRLGRRLSMRAHGDGPIQRPQRLSRIGGSQASDFAAYAESKEGDSSGVSLKRTHKVAKTRYSDHGDHQNHQKSDHHESNILKRMTMNATDLFRLWQASEQQLESGKGAGKKRRSPHLGEPDLPKMSSLPGDVSPQRFAFSQLALDGATQQPSESNTGPMHAAAGPLLGGRTSDPSLSVLESDSRSSHQFHNSAGQQHGLLSAVIESSNSSQRSTPLTQRTNDNSTIRSKGSHQSMRSAPSYRSLPRGKCLTVPSEGVANDQEDNVDGNLILFENDSISVGRKQIHVLTREKMKNATHADFRIQGLLGQGTFAQVFQCLHLQTGNLVAMKVIKNKPAYTRQAAVEIDVFRALTSKSKSKNAADDEENSSRSNITKETSTPTTNNSVATTVAEDSGQKDANKEDYLVDMVCYFMYKNHLCLVFEILGLNLYEVLKKRQFRGLPLVVVRRLVKQAVGAVKELSKKSIVHCDLKPENILLVTEDDVDSVVSAGESRRLSSSLNRGSLSVGGGSLDKVTGKPRGSSEKKSKEPPAEVTGVEKMVNGVPPVTNLPVSQSPANSLGTNTTVHTVGMSMIEQKIKLIDFGSACFEGQTAHTYIQSRFYRSPEVLVGLPYDSGIDMWSLGCVAAELFLGLPILPGIHEHDQLSRMHEMIGKLPDWMLDQGSKASKYFVKYVPGHTPTGTSSKPGTPRPLPQWRLQSQQEYIASLSHNEIRKKGGMAKLEKQTSNRYFKRKKLDEIVMQKGMNGNVEDRDTLELFVHFLYGILDPDPWKRWTAHQAACHPFIAGGPVERRKDRPDPATTKDENQANLVCNIYWEAPWDPGICRRKLLNVQKVREKHHATRRGYPNVSHSRSHATRASQATPSSSDSSSGDSLRKKQSPPPGANAGSGLSTQLEQQHRASYQISSSLSAYCDVGGTRVAAGDSSVISSNVPYLTGPQSYSEVYQGTMPGSIAEMDFAYALQRPGVVPMGESMTSSVDMHSIQGLSTQHSVQSMGVQRQQSRGPLSSRSVGEIPDSSSEPGRFMPAAAPPSFLGQPSSLQSNANLTSGGMTPCVELPAGQLSLNSQMVFPGQALPGQVITGQDAQSYGHAQAFIQQQHAALQQQQALLQRQQEALVMQQQALQQQQLQAYGMNPAFLQQQQQQQQSQQFGQSGGYYYVSSTGGANPMMPVPGQSVAYPGMSPAGMPPPFGMPIQSQNASILPYGGNGVGSDRPFNPAPAQNNSQRFRGGMSM